MAQVPLPLSTIRVRSAALTASVVAVKTMCAAVLTSMMMIETGTRAWHAHPAGGRPTGNRRSARAAVCGVVSRRGVAGSSSTHVIAAE